MDKGELLPLEGLKHCLQEGDSKISPSKDIILWTVFEEEVMLTKESLVLGVMFLGNSEELDFLFLDL